MLNSILFCIEHSKIKYIYIGINFYVDKSKKIYYDMSGKEIEYNEKNI